MDNPIVQFGNTTLRGVSQVFLQNNWITGLLFLIGIFLGSVSAGLYALLGVVVATATALLLGITYDSIKQGLYGFNGTLVGIAIGTSFQPGLLIPLYVIIAAAFSTIVTAAIGNIIKPTPVLTAPFVLTTWIFLGAFSIFGHLDPASTLNKPTLPFNSTTGAIGMSPLDMLVGLLTGVGQVMLQQSVWTGIAFLLGLLISSPPACVAAIVGSLLGMLTAWLMGAPAHSLQAGLFGYNSVLTIIALSGTFYPLNANNAIFACFAAIVASVVSAMFTTFVGPFGIPSLTAAFVVTTWLCLFGKSAFTRLNTRNLTTTHN